MRARLWLKAGLLSMAPDSAKYGSRFIIRNNNLFTAVSCLLCYRREDKLKGRKYQEQKGPSDCITKKFQIKYDIQCFPEVDCFGGVDGLLGGLITIYRTCGPKQTVKEVILQLGCL